ncbi:plasmid pRiA4b ORF-3 family protein [Arthrobacter polaris]|uniref:plasmid pRiA4b ORF-3 family protein n=1 Tax=Arthrobacter polaris TaxID=2813727 RepID=UPI001F2A696D|nr:plasmid pRiA4b ORF-3 family protein [Arthrobacter polaris]UIK88375.1 hypothetical protein J0916_13435 [Arthrobacter polaris]
MYRFEYIHGSKVEILQLKVMLKGSKPPVWRRLLIRSDLTLAEFDFGDTMPLDEAAGSAEDGGGLWGWESMVEAVSKPSHEEHSEYRERLGLMRVKRLIPRALTRTEWPRSFLRCAEESTTTALAFQPQLACR